MPYRTQHRGFEARPPYNTVEPDDGIRITKPSFQNVQRNLASGLNALNRFRKSLPDVPQPIVDVSDAAVNLWNQTPYGQLEQQIPQEILNISDKAGLPNPVGQGLSIAGAILVPGPGDGMAINKAVGGLDKARRLSIKPNVTKDIDLFPPNQALQPELVGVNNNMMINPRQDIDLAELSAQPLQVGHKMERSTRTDILEGLINADAPNPQIVDYLQKGPGGAISPKYTNRPGYFTADGLAARPEVIEQLFTRNKNIKNLQEKYLNKLSISRADPSKKNIAATSNAQRAWYDEVAKNLFSDDMLIYGKDKPRKLVAQATKWITRDEWHHIFGNKEAGEFLMSQVTQDPLVAVNLMAHMKHLGLNSSGIAKNIAIMKKAGHNNFHKWLKEMGFESVAGKQAPLAIDQYSTEISKYITEGVQTTAQIGEKGKKLKSKFYPPNPDAVNDLFGMLEYYAEANKFIRQQLKAGKVTMEDGTVLSLAAGKTEKLPEVMSELKSKKISGVGDVLRSGELMKQVKIGTRGRTRKR